jgi:muramoyltetrapeptide carboxypeptidase
VAADVLSRHRYLAGTDGRRASELRAAFDDPDTRAVVCARAGYGCGRLLPLLDFAALARRPKVFVGYSDAALLLNLLVQRAGVVAFHGPMVARDFAEGLSARSRDHFVRLLTTGKGEDELSCPHTLRGGVGEGPLLGGCLSVLVSVLGTPFAVDTRGAVLFLEDVDEKPYRIDRMLTQLEQAGCLSHLAGVVFGEMRGCWGEGGDAGELLEVIAEFFARYPYPVAFGRPARHGGGENLTLALGVRVRLDGGRLIFLEPAVE